MALNDIIVPKEGASGVLNEVVLTPAQIGAANTTHAHAIADVTNLQITLDGKQASGSYAASSHIHPDATTSVAGFMSSTDKTKLNGVAAGAEVNVNADWNATTGDAAILNKPSTFAPTAHAASHHTGGTDALTAANIGAAATAHSHAAADITSGTLDNARVNFAAPAAIGNTTPAAGTFSTLTANTSLAVAGGIVTGASNVLEMVNGSNAQTLRIYSSFSLANIFSRLSIRGANPFSGNHIIATEKGTSGGTA